MNRSARLALAGLLLSATIVAAVADRIAGAPARSVPAVRPSVAGGVWACPIVAAGKTGALQLFNPSAEATTARVRWVRPPAKPVNTTVTVKGGTAVSMPVPGGTPDSGAGAIVEWGGGELVVARSSTVRTILKRTVAVGGACSQPGDAVLVMPGISTFNRDSQVVLLNPSSADALVDVSFAVEGDEVTPENARARVVSAGGRLVLRVNDFLFDRKEAGVIVRVSTGTVVADAIVTADTASMIVPAAAPISSGVGAITAFRGMEIRTVTVGDEPSTIDATTLSARTRGSTANFPPGIEPLRPSTVVLSNVSGPHAISAEVREGSPFGSVLTWSVPDPHGSDAAAMGVQRPTARWLGVAGAPAAHGRDVRLTVANAGDRPAVLTIRVFTPRGEQPAGAIATVTLPAGRVSSYVLAFATVMPVAVEVTSDEAPIMASLVVRVGFGTKALLYATGGISTEPAAAVPLRIDPRTGVDAR